MTPEIPKASYEKPKNSMEELGDLASSVNKKTIDGVKNALKALSNPETRAEGVAYLLTLVAKLTGVKTAEKAKTTKVTGVETPDTESVKPKVKAEGLVKEDAEEERQEVLDNAEVALNEATERSGKGTDKLPYRTLFTGGDIANGGCPGFVDGNPEGKFDFKMAVSQLTELHKRGIKNIFSLAKSDKIEAVIWKLKAEGIDMNFHSAVLNASDETISPKNEEVFRQIAEMGPTYVHCRHGAHRAIVATTGAFLVKGASSLGEAFKRAGGNMDNFRGRSYAMPMISQLVDYSQKHGIQVEEEFKKGI